MFPENGFGFKLELVDELTEIIPSAFVPFIGNHQRLFASVKTVFEKKKILGFYNIAKIT